MSRRSTAPLEAVVLPDLPPPRGNRWGIVLVSLAFVAVLAAIVGVVWGLGKLATTVRVKNADEHSLVGHWEEPQERLANISRAMNSREVGAPAAELRDLQRLLTRVANACRSGDDQAYQECFDMNLLVHRISRHPAVRDDRTFSARSLKSELEAGMTTLSQVGEFSVVRVERGERGDLALVYTVDWSPSFTTGCRWWLARNGRNWRVFDWERLDYEQSLAHTWAIRGKLNSDSNSYNYTMLRGAIDGADGGRSGGTDLASLIDVPLPEIIHDAAMFDLAWALIGQNRHMDAIRACDSLRRPQDHPGYLVIRARAQAALGRHAKALADARRYQELAGRDPLALEQAADSLVQLDRHEEAAQCWRKMLHLAPNHSEALGYFCQLAGASQREELSTIFRTTRQPVEMAVSQAQSALYRDDLEMFELLAAFVKSEARDLPSALLLDAQRLQYEGQYEQAASQFRNAAEAEVRPDKKAQSFNQFLSAMVAAGKVAEGYAAAQDPQAAFDFLTAGADADESSLTDAQLKILLAEHEKRVATDARADYCAGQLLLREEQYAAADVKFQAAIAKAEKDQQAYYQGGRVEALHRLGRWTEAYDTFGHTTEVFRDLARFCENDGDWGQLRSLIERHRANHPTDRWIDYYEAKIHQDRGESALALTAILRAEQGDEQLKAFSRRIKMPLLIEAGRMHQVLSNTENRRQDFLDLASQLIGDEDWPRLNDLYQAHSPLLGRDAAALNAWTNGLWKQGKLDEVAQSLEGELTFDMQTSPGILNALYERKVRCLLRLDRKAEARQAAESASAKFGFDTPLVMVLLAEEKIAVVRDYLADRSQLKALLAQPLDDDPELALLLSHPEFSAMREQFVLPLSNYDRDISGRVILLLREGRETTTAELAGLLSKTAPAAMIGAVPHATGDARRSFRIDHEGTTVLLTYGSQPYWKRGRYRRTPRDERLAELLNEHRGFIVLECDRGAHESGRSSDHLLLSTLAAELCGEDALAVHSWRPGSSYGSLAAFHSAMVDELRSGQFLNRKQTAGESFMLFDSIRYPDDADGDVAAPAMNPHRRTAIRIAQQMHAHQKPTAEVLVDLWRGHARESIWLNVVAARKDAHGGWQLHGQLPADSVLRPNMRSGTRLAVGPYEVREMRER